MRQTPPRKSAPTIKDVARHADVSLGSVSRVLNKNPTVTDSVKNRVLAAIDYLGYTPNIAAQSIRNPISKTVACIIRDITIPGFGSFVNAAYSVLLNSGYALLLSTANDKIEREKNLVSVLTSRKVDGLLIAQSSEVDPDLDRILKSSNVPVVLIDRQHPEWADAVMVDHKRGIQRATQKLLQMGHRRIALITGNSALYPARARIEGFEAAYSAENANFSEAVVATGGFDSDFGFEQTSLIMSQQPPTTALIAGGIEMLPGVIKALQLQGLSIPQDVSLVGTLTTPLSELYQPAISMENWNYSEVGRIAARFLIERMNGELDAPPKRITVPAEFLVTDSCAPPSR